MTRYEEQMYNDIHRIANALEKIAKHFTEDNKNEVEEKNVPLTSPISILSPVSNMCEGCYIYEEMKKGKTIVNDACSFCSKNPFKVTYEATNNDK